MTSAALTDAPLTTTLEPVRALIPDDCYERSTARGLGHSALAVVLHGLVLWALFSVHNPFGVIGLWLLAGLTTASMFVIGHDAAHQALFDDRKLNGIVGRALMLPSMHVYEAWVLGHNRIHHGHTVRQGMDFVWHPSTVEEFAAMSRYARLRHRFEWSWAGSGAYYAREVWWNKMITFSPPEKYAKAIKRDWWLVMLATVAMVGGAGTLGWFHGGFDGAVWMVVKLIIVPVLLFMQIIGWTVYVHHVDPKIRWWPRREWNKFRGQMEGTTVLRFPAAFNWLFFHNIFVHVPHHVDQRLPFYSLPRATAAIEAGFPGVVIDVPFRPGRYFRAAHQCKLYDFEAGTWLDYSGKPIS